MPHYDVQDDRYNVPAPLVHRAIVGIVGSVVAIVGYMVVWALNDAAWKATISNRLLNIDNTLQYNSSTLARVPVIDSTLQINMRRIDILEQHDAELQRRISDSYRQSK